MYVYSKALAIKKRIAYYSFSNFNFFFPNDSSLQDCVSKKSGKLHFSNFISGRQIATTKRLVQDNVCPPPKHPQRIYDNILAKNSTDC